MSTPEHEQNQSHWRLEIKKPEQRSGLLKRLVLHKKKGHLYPLLIYWIKKHPRLINRHKIEKTFFFIQWVEKCRLDKVIFVGESVDRVYATELTSLHFPQQSSALMLALLVLAISSMIYLEIACFCKLKFFK